MRLCAIFVLCIEFYAGLHVAGTKCGDRKCSSVFQKHSSGPDEPVASEQDEQENDKYTCCACGGATYDITFTGKWTKGTYPRHFPGQMARWSPLIGSSHSKDYIVWQYGEWPPPVSRLSVSGELLRN
ncbi:hypothetical protein OS493_017702 [Desmophyllum pertusum]|uniref:Spondin domain-containing protein n=1 Tax=Desmophyllum pertusum TaxID=174260 RepID=A0A9X0CYM8_9CNID|nr:hypothetical protein OS493_017702 [Desmophyllum pertusum]